MNAAKAKDEVDKKTYEATKPYLKAALEHLIQAGRTVRDFFDFAVERFGGAIVPYVRRFEREVREGTVKIAGLTKSTREAVLGQSAFETGKATFRALKNTAEKDLHVVKDVVSDWVAKRPSKAPEPEAEPQEAAAKTTSVKETAAKKKAGTKDAAEKPKKAASAKKTAPRKKAETKAAPKKKTTTKKAAVKKRAAPAKKKATTAPTKTS